LVAAALAVALVVEVLVTAALVVSALATVVLVAVALVAVALVAVAVAASVTATAVTVAVAEAAEFKTDSNNSSTKAKETCRDILIMDGTHITNIIAMTLMPFVVVDAFGRTGIGGYILGIACIWT
jgi:hypothetical protein